MEGRRLEVKSQWKMLNFIIIHSLTHGQTQTRGQGSFLPSRNVGPKIYQISLSNMRSKKCEVSQRHSVKCRHFTLSHKFCTDRHNLPGMVQWDSNPLLLPHQKRMHTCFHSRRYFIQDPRKCAWNKFDGPQKLKISLLSNLYMIWTEPKSDWESKIFYYS